MAEMHYIGGSIDRFLVIDGLVETQTRQLERLTGYGSAAGLPRFVLDFCNSFSLHSFMPSWVAGNLFSSRCG